MEKPFVYYNIHNSHTDIGYTDYQEKLERYHVEYIKEVIDILRAAEAEKKADDASGKEEVVQGELF